jgi:hypothetical protein
MENAIIRFGAPFDRTTVTATAKICRELYLRRPIWSVCIPLFGAAFFAMLCQLFLESPLILRILYFAELFALIALILMLSDYIKKKKSHRKEMEQYLYALYGCNENITYEFSESGMLCIDCTRNDFIPWELFSSWSFYKGYLILWLPSGYTCAFKENTEGLNSETYAQLLALIKTKLPLT